MTTVVPRLLLCLWLLASLAACESDQPPLELTDVFPHTISSDEETAIRITGSFYAPVAADLGSGSQHLQDEFQVELADVPLLDVILVSGYDLWAMVPAGFAVGRHDLRVTDPLGREAELVDALRVRPQDARRPVVEITSHESGDHVLPGETVIVSFFAYDLPPGVVQSYAWLIYNGGVLDDGSRVLEDPHSDYFGFVRVLVPVEPVSRELRVLIVAQDDASDLNEGSDSVVLLIDLCQEDEECDDGLFCNGQEICDDGACSMGEFPNCNDGLSCTIDDCIEEEQACSHEPDDSLCDNLSYCDGQETCDQQQGCLDGLPPCDDRIECTVDVCEESTIVGEPGTCRSVPNDDLCDDREFCNGIERCEHGYGCVDGPDPCLDLFECTQNTCYEADRLCEVVVDHILCNDGLACTTDVCDKYVGCTNSPGTEGPTGHRTCTDGVDNDCDELIDGDDPDCD